MYSWTLVYTFGSEYTWGGVAGSKETEDDALPMWDIAHAENSKTSSLGCAASCEKDGKMVRNQAELSVKINERNHLVCLFVSGEATTALMVSWTLPHQTLFPLPLVRVNKVL